MSARALCLFLMLLLPFQWIAASPVGLSFTYPVIANEPANLHGYRAAITYQPKSFVWKQTSIYFDASYGHWWVTGDTPYTNLSIYSIAPYLRIYFYKKPSFAPFFEASVGLAYLTKTRIDGRNLGMHFAFQDQLNLGVAFGAEQQFYTSIGALHYSNGSLCASNSGITAPLTFNMGYRF